MFEIAEGILIYFDDIVGIYDDVIVMNDGSFIIFNDSTIVEC